MRPKISFRNTDTKSKSTCEKMKQTVIENTVFVKKLAVYLLGIKLIKKIKITKFIRSEKAESKSRLLDCTATKVGKNSFLNFVKKSFFYFFVKNYFFQI